MKFKNLVNFLLFVFIVFLGCSTVEKPANYSANLKNESVFSGKIEKVEFFYVPNTTRMEISMDVEFLKDTTHKWISYVCISESNILEEIEIILDDKNFIKSRVEKEIEPFCLIKVTNKERDTFQFTKEKLRFFSLNSKNYFNVELEKWMKENLPIADPENKKRICCKQQSGFRKS